MQQKKGKAEIISIGDELLIGQVVNTNASWMAGQLGLAGFSLERITTIGDNEHDIHHSLKEATSRAEFVLLTGGLGPTADDITKPALCSFMNTGLVFNEEALKQIEKLFAERNMPVTDRNRAQALLPENCEPIPNANGTAPGMWFNFRGSFIISMPGVPFEMKTMFAQQIIPRMLAKSEKRVFLYRTVMTTGMGESWLADRISEWEAKLPENLRLAYLPQPGIVRLRISGTGKDAKVVKAQIEEQVSQLTALLPDLVYGYDDCSMEEVIGDRLRQLNKTVSTAESCTGGYLAHLITSVPGSSAYFRGAIIAYENNVKSELLGVDAAVISADGAVSRSVVEAMARGARNKLKTDFALATSGIAGPDGGTDDKPVGTVWIALATPEETISERFQFGGDRGRNIRRSSLAALNILRLALDKFMH